MCIFVSEKQTEPNKQQEQKKSTMKKILTYPMGVILKMYMAYAFVLVYMEKRKTQRAEKAAIRKPELTAAH